MVVFVYKDLVQRAVDIKVQKGYLRQSDLVYTARRGNSREVKSTTADILDQDQIALIFLSCLAYILLD